MSDALVSIERLSKRYRIRHQSAAPYETLRDAMARALSPRRWFGARNGSPSATAEDFWALRNVSFDVARGEVVGIIGRNGAGKSTLLKILSRITEPTEGRVTLDGRVASLLEVGTGFHPELTGRENIYLNGAILGMTRAEISRKFESIVGFAEVERFLDTPVKRYSSGMYVRLAFAVAAHLEPEVLIVDEVLAVGDAEFQKKSLGKMHEVSRGGRTVLFVSHNMAAIQALCNRAIWLHDGSVAANGAVGETIAAYLAGAHAVERGLAHAVPVGETLELRRFDLTPNPAASGDRVAFALTFAARSAAKISEIVLLIYSSLETRVAIVDLRSAGLPVTLTAGQEWSLSGWIASLPVVEGAYRFGLYLGTSDFADDLPDLVQLDVQARAKPGGHAPYPVEHRGLVELEFGVTS